MSLKASGSQLGCTWGAPEETGHKGERGPLKRGGQEGSGAGLGNVTPLDPPGCALCDTTL